jgi:hypothetical protein
VIGPPYPRLRFNKQILTLDIDILLDIRLDFLYKLMLGKSLDMSSFMGSCAVTLTRIEFAIHSNLEYKRGGLNAEFNLVPPFPLAPFSLFSLTAQKEKSNIELRFVKISLSL